jgi:hypothetical protein
VASQAVAGRATSHQFRFPMLALSSSEGLSVWDTARSVSEAATPAATVAGSGEAASPAPDPTPAPGSATDSPAPPLPVLLAVAVAAGAGREAEGGAWRAGVAAEERPLALAAEACAGEPHRSRPSQRPHAAALASASAAPRPSSHSRTAPPSTPTRT